MFFRTIVKLFDRGNVCVTGLRGDGKDMLTSNVVVRRRLPYVSNVNYDGRRSKRAKRYSIHFPFNPMDYDTKNTYKEFINGNVQPYKFPFPDGTDIYISDAGVYFPSQYCSELNKQYGGLVSFMALSRHLGQCNVHINVQNLNRCWDKIREQSDLYVRCDWCKVFFGRIVLQKVTLYESYDSCVKRVPPFRMKAPLLNADRIQQYEIAKTNFMTNYGKIRSGILLYVNKSKYDTRIFKTILTKEEIIKRQISDELRSELRADFELKGSVDNEKKVG